MLTARSNVKSIKGNKERSLLFRFNKQAKRHKKSSGIVSSSVSSPFSFFSSSLSLVSPPPSFFSCTTPNSLFNWFQSSLPLSNNAARMSFLVKCLGSLEYILLNLLMLCTTVTSLCNERQRWSCTILTKSS